MITDQFFWELIYGDALQATRTGPLNGAASRSDEGSNDHSLGGGATRRTLALGRNPLGRRRLGSGSLPFVGPHEIASLPAYFAIPPAKTRRQ
jgi:hypothetical protein